jgi:hypothetical protein
MLQNKLVEQPTLDLLNKINQSSLFNKYLLVGGTAIVLIHGNIKLIDLYFFGTIKFTQMTSLSFLNQLQE